MWINIDNLTDADYEVARLAIENTLIWMRDDHISTLNRNNGLVVKEMDGTPSSIIRLGPEAAVRIGLRAIVNARSMATAAESPSSSRWTQEELVAALRVHGAEIREADEWRPLADHVLALLALEADG